MSVGNIYLAVYVSCPQFSYLLLRKWKAVTQSYFNSLQPHELQPTKLLCPWDFPGKNTGVGLPFPSPGNFPTQGSNPGLLHCRQILWLLSHQEMPGPILGALAKLYITLTIPHKTASNIPLCFSVKLKFREMKKLVCNYSDLAKTGFRCKLV